MRFQCSSRTSHQKPKSGRISFTAVGCIAQLITSIPAIPQLGAGPGGLAVSVSLISIGAGGVRAVILPFLGDQNTLQEFRVVRRPDGTTEVIDHRLTLQLIYNVFYG